MEPDIVKQSGQRLGTICDLSSEQIASFQERIYKHYRSKGRELPWRKTRDPYKILVSELMLQQTQVERVLVKYPLFLNNFPTFSALSNAPLKNVLEVWQGLGYNKRAIALKRIAQTVATQFMGKLPSDYSVLTGLPGIGHTTACAIRTFAFDIPSVFIETNIRTVYIYTFYAEEHDIKDDSLYPLVESTLDRSNPRNWYYALMDYGSMLKRQHTNPSRKSARHKKQAPFKGSNRQLRGKIISLIIVHSGITETDLTRRLNADPQAISRNLQKLQEEGFLKREQSKIFIA
ncbi:MAG TPA: winged helix-turn-helix transcriptional regulator [archaeon]